MTKKLLLKNQILNLELSGIIVSKNLIPDFTNLEFYKNELYKTFNHKYEINEIQESLDLLLGQQNQQEEIMIYPDDQLEGI